MNSAALYINESQVDEKVRTHLDGEVKIRPYEYFISDLGELGQEYKEKDSVRFLIYFRLHGYRGLSQILIGRTTSLAVASALGHVRILLLLLQSHWW